jgi:hypothetical protein
MIQQKYAVKIRGCIHTIHVYQNSKSIWIAAADCLGHRLEVKAPSATSAIALWRQAAELQLVEREAGEPKPRRIAGR